MTTVPLATSFSGDLSTGWTEAGSPTYGDDHLGNAGTALIGDGVDNIINRSPFITNGSGANHTLNFWLKFATPGGSSFPIGQRNASDASQNVFDVNCAATTMTCGAWTDGSNITQSSLVYSNNGNFDDDAYHMITLRLQSTNLDIFRNGTEGSYTGGLDSNNIGAGFTGVPASGIVNISAGNITNGSLYFTGRVARVAAWEGTALSDAEIAQLYTNELAGQDPTVSAGPDARIVARTQYLLDAGPSRTS